MKEIKMANSNLTPKTQEQVASMTELRGGFTNLYKGWRRFITETSVTGPNLGEIEALFAKLDEAIGHL